MPARSPPAEPVGILASERRASFPSAAVPAIVPYFTERVPVVVIVPPLSPVPPVTLVTVPDPPPPPDMPSIARRISSLWTS